jgi:HEAT repeat protein
MLGADKHSMVNTEHRWIYQIPTKVAWNQLTQEEYANLIPLLNHRKARVRWYVADQLGKIGDPRAVDALIVALKDSHWLVRLHAAKALGRIGNLRAIESLVNAISDESPFVRRRVAVALGKFDNDNVISSLATALSDLDKSVRVGAIQGLSGVRSSYAISLIASVVRDPNANVSWRAVEALEKIGAEATNSLIVLLMDSDYKVRYRVIKTLGRMGDERAIGPLKEVLNREADKMLHWRAELALGQIRHWQAFSRESTRT